MENKIEKFLPIDQKDRDLVLPLLLLEKADKPSPGFFSASVDQKKSKKQKNQDKRAKNRLNVCGILFFPFLYFIFFSKFVQELSIISLIVWFTPRAALLPDAICGKKAVGHDDNEVEIWVEIEKVGGNLACS